MIKVRFIALVCILSLLCTVFAGCGANGGESGAPTEPEYSLIVLKDYIPEANVGASYNLGQILVKDEDAKYSYTATYQDPESGDTKKLTVKSGKFTPKAEADIQVTIRATKDSEEETRTVTIPMGITADVLDRFLCSSGVAGSADAGVTKEIVKDSQYLKAEDSISALQVSFSNPADAGKGIKLLELSHYSLMAYYSSRVWDNAAVTMWVFNPMEQDVELKLTSHNSVTGKSLLWNSSENSQLQIAKAGQWTQVNFSLYQMGIEQVLYNSYDGMRVDSLELQARYQGSETATVYIDGVNVVDAATISGLETGYIDPVLPQGDFSDLFSSCKVYNGDNGAEFKLTQNGNNSRDSYCIGANTAIGYPTFYVDLPQETDISGFDYMKFDVYAEKCYPYVSVAIRYIDEEGNVKHQGTSYDFYREQWRTIYVNLDYLDDVDLTRVVGFNFSINVASHVVENAFNCIYFDNFSLYEHDQNEPELSAPMVEDHDLISGPMKPTNIKPGTSGVCKVTEDETGTSKSNSTLLFWTNNACGYPNVYTTFRFDYEQDWSDYNVLNFDTHQFNGHYWMGFTILTLDEDGNERELFWRHDTVLTHWMTNSAPLSWFTTPDGSSAKPEDLKRVVGFKIAVDMAVNVTDEVAMIFFDNFYVS